MAFPFLTISSNENSLNTGSFYSDKDLSTFNISQSTDIFFGNSSQDVIEFSTYDINGNLNRWNILQKKDTYNILNGTYKDVDGNDFSYSYKKYNNSYTISSDRKILLNTRQDLLDSGIQSGSQVVSYNFLRNIAGNNSYKLIIKSVSVDRKEIQLIPSFKLDITNEENLLQNLNFEGFSRKMILVNDIAEKIIAKFKNFNASVYYNSNPIGDDTKSAFKALFGFQTDADIVKFLNDLFFGLSMPYQQYNGKTIVTNFRQYDGIQTFINNWIYTYYKNLVNISDLQNQFQYIVNTATQKNLIILNNNYQNIDTNNIVSKFINSIFYDNFILPLLNSICGEYNKKYYSYLKNSLNFGNNEFFPIINHNFITDANNNTVLVIKLFDILPQNINVRDTCWVSNIAMNSIIQKVILNAPVVKTRYKISGPNFKINPKIKTIPVTKNETYKSKNDLDNTNLKHQIEFNKKLKTLNVDYSNFSNFILFSSAQLRIKLFANKLNQLTGLSSSLANINNSVSNNLSISSSYQYDTSAINSQINDIFDSFDGYESYLYTNQNLISGSNYSNYLSGAIEYDYENRDSLVNNTPEYINLSDENSDYLVFLSLIGHFFDNIYLYIQNFPTTQYLNNASSNSFINSISDRLLEQFGWTPISSHENSSREHYYLPPITGSFSNKDKMEIIWNRILNNLPMIYKTKGTEEAIRMLANIYGIPYSFLNIKEFGGNYTSEQDKSSYSFDARYYFTRYSGSNEYVSVPYNPSVQSVEFKFSIDINRKYNTNDTVILLYKDSNFSVFLTKTREDYMGTLSFQLYDQILTTNILPFFNGKIFNVLIKQEHSTSIYFNQIPALYSIKTNCIENDMELFSDSMDMLLNNSYDNYFTIGNQLLFGNNPNSNNNFYGTMDKINVWNTTLSDDAFLEHSKNFDGYNDYNPNNTYANLYYRYSFEYPVDLSVTNPVNITNKHSAYSITSSAYNFLPNSTIFNSASCGYVPFSKYPYQFNELNITQNVVLSNLSPNKFNNNKILKVNQNVLSRLMPNELSSTPIDVKYNSNLVAACISPYSVRDNDIINFLGDYDILNILGDPKYLYSSSYQELDVLRKDYNNYNLAEPVLYQEFFTIYKNYIDASFFDSVKQLIPARSKLLLGTLIESNILERNKIQNKPIKTDNVEIIDMTPNNYNFTLSASPTASIYDNIFSKVFSVNQLTSSLVSFVLELTYGGWNDTCAIAWNGKLTQIVPAGQEYTGSIAGYTSSLNAGTWILNRDDITLDSENIIDVLYYAKEAGVTINPGDVLNLYVKSNSLNQIRGDIWKAKLTYDNGLIKYISGGTKIFGYSYLTPEWYENGSITIPNNPIIPTNVYTQTLEKMSLKPTLSPKIQKESVVDLFASNTKYISNDHVDRRFSTFSTNGSAFIYNKDLGFKKEYIFKNQKSVYTLAHTPNLLNYFYLTGSTYQYDFSSNISGGFSGSLDTKAYPYGHYSTRFATFGSYFTTTSNNTVNSSGSLDSSSPIQMVSTNRNTAAQRLQI